MTLRIAVVGAGAAGMYAVGHLLEQTAVDVQIDLLERLPTPWGLIRSGVAPDHPEKKQITDRLFDLFLKHNQVRFFGNVTVGSDISHEELAARYEAVIYAVGAGNDKPIGLAGETLQGCWSAREFVAWYNGHPDCSDLKFHLSASRVVIIGTGNVALDVARILARPVSDLARTDIAEHALSALRDSRVREIVIIGRRGCHDAAFHNPELEELIELNDVEVEVEDRDLASPQGLGCNWETQRKVETLLRLASRRLPRPAKRIVFKFHHTPISVVGSDQVTGVAVRTSDGSIVIPCSLVIRAIGYRGEALPGLPFDPHLGVISNLQGRVHDEHEPRIGVYVTGWIKRGPRGVIGSNKKCAAETVACLLEDANAAKLRARVSGDLLELLASRGTHVVTFRGWQRIDAAERLAGHALGRPRLKKSTSEDLLRTATGPHPRVQQ